MTTRNFWQRPKLHFEEENNEDRKVSWLELFFDLYFVVAIASLAHNFSEDLTLSGLGIFVLTFIPVWWVWIGVTYYNERFETAGFENRLYTFLLMIPIAGLALFSHDVLHLNINAFILSYTLARFIILVMWAYGTYHNEKFRKTGTIYIIGFSVSIILCIIAVFLNNKMAITLFVLALAIDLLTPMFTIKENRKLPKFSTSKLPERFGLFMIIVLGEGVVGTINAIKDFNDVNLSIISFGILGVALTFSLWSVYFDFIGRRVADNTHKWKQFFWTYMHLPLVICYITIGASLTQLTEAYGDLTTNSKRFLIIGCSLSLFCVAIIEALLKKSDYEPTKAIHSQSLKYITGGLMLSLLFFVEILNSKIIMSIILILFLANIIYGFYVWFNQDIDKIKRANEAELSRNNTNH